MTQKNPNHHRHNYLKIKNFINGGFFKAIGHLPRLKNLHHIGVT